MSNFNCEKCNATCVDSDDGYITGCEHYPRGLEPTEKQKFDIYMSYHVSEVKPLSADMTEAWEAGQNIFVNRYGGG